MRSNSGSGKSNNNLHDPTLRDAERARGHSGAAGSKGSRSETARRKGTTGTSTSNN